MENLQTRSDFEKKRKKIIVLSIISLVIIILCVYLANIAMQRQKFNNDCKKLIDKYNFIDNYKFSGYLNCVLEINVNDKFSKLSEKEKTSQVSNLYTAYEFLNRSYYIKNFKDIKKIDNSRLVEERKIIVNDNGSEFVYNYKNIERPKSTVETTEVNIPNNNKTITSSNLSDEEMGFAWAVAIKEVKNVLKSPSSAKFPFSYSGATITKTNNLYTVNSYVEADNSFGAKLKVKFSILFERNGNKYTVKNVLVDE